MTIATAMAEEMNRPETLCYPLERAVGSWPDPTDASRRRVSASPGVAVWRGSAFGGVEGRHQPPGDVESDQQGDIPCLKDRTDGVDGML